MSIAFILMGRIVFETDCRDDSEKGDDET